MNTNAILIMALPMLCLGITVVVLVIWAARTMIEQGSKSEVWAEFSKQIGGIFTPKAHGMPDTIKAKLGDWPVYLDTYVAGVNGAMVDYTRLRAFYAARKPFELVMRSPLADHDAGITLHMTKVSAVFHDPSVVMYSSDSTAASRFVADINTMAVLQAVNPLDLQIRRRRNWRNSGLSNSIYEVHVQSPHVVTDIASLMNMYALIAVCQERLLLMGYAHRSFADAGSTLPTEQEPLS